MVQEVVILNIKKGLNDAFEADFKKASQYIRLIDGYISHSLNKCIDKDNQYLLRVKWKTIEDHKIGFRTSEAYMYWKELLHHYYDPFPKVNYYTIGMFDNL